jgi:hypothetical protein
MNLFKPYRAEKKPNVSTFLERLNTDIRLQIYREVLSSMEQTLHIYKDKQRGRHLGHFPCETPDGWNGGDRFTWGNGRWESVHMFCFSRHFRIQDQNEWKWFKGKTKEPGRAVMNVAVLSLLLSCKVMYENKKDFTWNIADT